MRLYVYNADLYIIIYPNLHRSVAVIMNVVAAEADFVDLNLDFKIKPAATYFQPVLYYSPQIS